MEIKPRFTVEMTDEEIRLVGLALAGKLRGPDVVDALKLNEKVLKAQLAPLETRVKNFRTALAENAAQLKSVAELEGK